MPMKLPPCSVCHTKQKSLHTSWFLFQEVNGLNAAFKYIQMSKFHMHICKSVMLCMQTHSKLLCEKRMIMLMQMQELLWKHLLDHIAQSTILLDQTTHKYHSDKSKLLVACGPTTHNGCNMFWCNPETTMLLLHVCRCDALSYKGQLHHTCYEVLTKFAGGGRLLCKNFTTTSEGKTTTQFFVLDCSRWITMLPLPIKAASPSLVSLRQEY